MVGIQGGTGHFVFVGSLHGAVLVSWVEEWLDNKLLPDLPIPGHSLAPLLFLQPGPLCLCIDSGACVEVPSLSTTAGG